MEFQIRTIGHLRSLFRQETEPVFLLGAGASAKSGIPLSDAIFEKIAKYGYCLEKGLSPESPETRRSDWHPWLRKQRWYREDLDPADNYPYAVDNILQPQAVRRDFFQDILNAQVPASSGYKRMAELMAQKRVRSILTTNFDTVLLDWYERNPLPHHVDVIKTRSDYTKFSTRPTHPQIIYLHGSVDHYTDKNNLAEVQFLDDDLVSMLDPLLRDHPLIVIGYRGAEPSVMKHLLIDRSEISNGYRNGIYWCVRNYEEEGPDSLPPFVHELADKIGGNFHIVDIKGFDEVMEELWEHFSEQQPTVSEKSITTVPPEAVNLPYDFKQINESSMDDFEWATMRTRLVQYCEKTNIRMPFSVDDDWVIQRLCDQDLVVRTEAGEIFPTVGGYLLFAARPQNHIQSAQVVVRVTGNPEWLESVFNDSSDDNEIIGDYIERTIEGNLWNQLDEIFDILSLVNQPFLLKGEISTTVQPYPPAALREIIVNALVHRDYTQSKPIVIEIRQTDIRVRNPGGLVPEVIKQVENAPNFEKEIKRGARKITGYRNRVVADLFYGAGVMEKEGSGLSDVWRSGNENRNAVNFGPVDSNAAFEITIHCRPEVVDEVTRTAYSRNFVRYASNLLEVAELPDVIWHVKNNARRAHEVFEKADEKWVPPFLLHEGSLFTFHDLSVSTNPLSTQVDIVSVEKMSVEEFTENYGEPRLVRFLNECLYRHLKSLGLLIDKYRKRAYFPRICNSDRTIKYQARVRRPTRTVVKKRRRYWEHKSFWFRFEKFEDTWVLFMLPSYVFTTDGKYDLLEGKVVNRLSTARQSRDYNNVIHNDLVFWSWVLSGGQQSTFMLNTGPVDFQKDSISSNEIGEERFPQILIKANLSTTVFQDIEAENTLRLKQPEEIESKKLTQLESEFSQAISLLEEGEEGGEDVNPD